MQLSKPRTLNDVLTDYARAQEMANKNLDSVTPSTRPGVETAIRQAKAKLPQLRQEYLTEILKNSTAFFMRGEPDKQEKFAKIAVENGAFSVDAAAIFNQLADKIQPSIGGRREFSVTQAHLLDVALKEVVDAAGYDGRLVNTAITELKAVPNRESLVQYIQDLISRSNGSLPSVVAAQAEIIRQAMKAKFTGKRLVVVFQGTPLAVQPALAGLFSTATNVILDPNVEVDEEFARDTIMGTLKASKAAKAKPGSPKPSELVAPIQNDQNTTNQKEKQ